MRLSIKKRILFAILGVILVIAALARIQLFPVTPPALPGGGQFPVKISGVAVRPLDEALRYLEDEADRILPKGYVVDYTGESPQLRTEGNKFPLAIFGALIVTFPENARF